MILDAIRRAWKRYVDSLPRSEEPAPVPDAEIRREMHPPHPPDISQAFDALADLVTAHLPPEVSAKVRPGLSARLKPGISPSEALARWIGANHGPKVRNLGLLCVDWKAREELPWQARRIARSHAVDLDWAYDVDGDRSWEGWEGRGETPVSAPLRSLAAALRPHGLALISFAHDDVVCAFAVRIDDESEARARAATLGLEVEHGVAAPSA